MQKAYVSSIVVKQQSFICTIYMYVEIELNTKRFLYIITWRAHSIINGSSQGLPLEYSNCSR